MRACAHQGELIDHTSFPLANPWLFNLVLPPLLVCFRYSEGRWRTPIGRAPVVWARGMYRMNRLRLNLLRSKRRI